MHDQMDKINKAFMKAFEDQNAEAIGPLLTEDSKIMPTGSDVVFGRKGIYFVTVLVNYLTSLILRVRLEQIMLFKLPVMLLCVAQKSSKFIMYVNYVNCVQSLLCSKLCLVIKIKL